MSGENPKKIKPEVILIVLIVVGVAALIGYAVILMNGNSDKNSSASSSSTYDSSSTSYTPSTTTPSSTTSSSTTPSTTTPSTTTPSTSTTQNNSSTTKKTGPTDGSDHSAIDRERKSLLAKIEREAQIANQIAANKAAAANATNTSAGDNLVTNTTPSDDVTNTVTNTTPTPADSLGEKDLDVVNNLPGLPTDDGDEDEVPDSVIRIMQDEVTVSDSLDESEINEIISYTVDSTFTRNRSEELIYLYTDKTTEGKDNKVVLSVYGVDAVEVEESLTKVAKTVNGISWTMVYYTTGGTCTYAEIGDSIIVVQYVVGSDVTDTAAAQELYEDFIKSINKK